ncbi:MAG TPA: hypothetical protein VHL10_10175 [Nitrososphaera sp.]|jgi:hypothetical protein|nr:hypothetical protein [Nitrososphaera sp.]
MITYRVYHDQGSEELTVWDVYAATPAEAIGSYIESHGSEVLDGDRLWALEAGR